MPSVTVKLCNNCQSTGNEKKKKESPDVNLVQVYKGKFCVASRNL